MNWIKTGLLALAGAKKLLKELDLHKAKADKLEREYSFRSGMTEHLNANLISDNDIKCLNDIWDSGCVSSYNQFLMTDSGKKFIKALEFIENQTCKNSILRDDARAMVYANATRQIVGMILNSLTVDATGGIIDTDEYAVGDTLISDMIEHR